MCEAKDHGLDCTTQRIIKNSAKHQQTMKMLNIYMFIDPDRRSAASNSKSVSCGFRSQSVKRIIFIKSLWKNRGIMSRHSIIFVCGEQRHKAKKITFFFLARL